MGETSTFYRTHTCGELRLEQAGQTVTLAGWMENLREVGQNLAFLVLRDFYGTTQVVLETEEMTAADHVEALMEHGLTNLDICLCNNATVSDDLLERYREEDARPIVIDRDRLARLGVEVAERPLTTPKGAQYARHDPEQLAEAVLELYRERGHTRIF